LNRVNETTCQASCSEVRFLRCSECSQKSGSNSCAPSLLLQQLPRRARASKANSLRKFTVSNIDEDKESQGSSDVELQSADEDNDDEDFEA